MGWEFRLLGAVEASVDGRRVQTGHARQQCVLVALLVDLNRALSVDQLLARVWSASPPPRAREGLYSYLSRLRRALRDSGDGDGERVGIFRDSGGYVMRADPDCVDLHRFRRLAAAARETTDDAVAHDRLDQALALWRGEPAAALAAPWLDELRAAVEAERLAASLDRHEVGLRLGRHAQLLGGLVAEAAAHPLDERLAGQVMLALHRCGRSAEALEHYRRTRQRLTEDLGIEPGSLLQELHRRILVSDSALDLAVGRGAEVGNEAATDPAGGPAIAVEAPPRQLPPAISSFVGRERELGRLDLLMSDRAEDGSASAILALVTGTAGVGKTALAVRWAHRVRQKFPDGQLYLHLRGHHPDGPVPPAAALAHALLALGLPPERVPVDADPAANLYRSVLADRRVLVLLDDAASAEQVRPLVPAAPGCLVLVTSRDDLAGLVARDDAHRLSLTVLTVDEAIALMRRILGPERVAEEPDATAELVARCAFLPLALRIAAAGLAGSPTLTIADYVERLSAADPLRVLDLGEDRQAAVGAAFEVSYERLPAAARRLFRLLGLVPGPDATADAAAILAGVPTGEAGALLRRLVAAHLLEERSRGRFSCHDLLRAYAVDRGRREDTQAERVAALDRLCRYYLDDAQAAADQLPHQLTRLPAPPETTGRAKPDLGGPAGALAWLDAERANLIAAITHAAAHGPRPVAVRLADVLRGYLWMRIGGADWPTAAGAALAAAEADGDLAGQAAARLSLALLHWRRDDYPHAIGEASKALALARRARWSDGESAALSNLGSLHQRSGRLAHAAAFHRRAMARDRQLGHTDYQAVDHTNLGVLYQDLGRMQAAVEELATALRLYRAGARGSECTILVNLGVSYRWLGRFPEAVQQLSAALSGARDIGDRETEAFALINLSAVRRDRGGAAEAFEALEAAHTALDIGREVASGRIEADALIALGTAHATLGEADHAAKRYAEALAVVTGTDNRITEAQAHLGLAASQRALCRLEVALSHAHHALDLAHAAGYRLHEGRAVTALAALALDRDEPVTAEREALRALGLHRATGYRMGEARTLLILGAALRACGAEDEAMSRWREALALFEAMGAAEAAAPRALLSAQT